MARPRPLRIGVVGGNSLDESLYGQAVEVGRLLAREGAVIFCGGMAGAMEAVCRGAAEEGGLTVGLLPDETIERANEHVTVPIGTGLGYGRNYLIVYNSDAVIAIGGSEGTLNEMAAALNLGLTVVSLGSWPLETLGRLRRGRLVHAAGAAEAVALALGAARSAPRRTPVTQRREAAGDPKARGRKV